MSNFNREYKQISKLIEEGEFGEVPSHLFSSEGRVPCDKLFSSLGKFFAHLRIHTNEKPFVCPVLKCGMGFNQKGNMKLHYERVHLRH